MLLASIQGRLSVARQRQRKWSNLMIAHSQVLKGSLDMRVINGILASFPFLLDYRTD